MDPPCKLSPAVANHCRTRASPDLLLLKILAIEPLHAWAIGRRLKRNYVFIFVVILIAWITKIFLHAKVTIVDWPTFRWSRWLKVPRKASQVITTSGRWSRSRRTI